MRIETASGHVILADNADYALIGDFSWWVLKQANGRFYAYARVRRDSCYPGRSIAMHRLIMDAPRGLVVHHKNNNGLDNRRCNLMVTTQRVNIRFANKCGTVYQQDGRWVVMVRDETGKQLYLGSFLDEKVAKARLKNWNYQKMLEWEKSDDPALMDLAKVIETELTECPI